jgi:hypothetical protein
MTWKVTTKAPSTNPSDESGESFFVLAGAVAHNLEGVP